MKATEVLKEEHKIIKKMLKILGRVCEKLEKNESVNLEHLENILDFIKTFADKCHHGKEEDLLFLAMEEAGIPKEGGPIGVMLYEHEIGREYVRNMADGISRYKNGDKGSIPQIIENARNYIRLLKDHIDKEDNILYVMADRHLSDKKQKELVEEFERVEREKIGKGVHEKYHDLVEELEKIYI